MLYLAQVIIYSGILWIVYMLLLRNKPIHSFNRAYLLSAVLLPLIVPFIKFPSLAQQYLGNEAPLGMRLPEVTIDASARPQAASTIQWVLVGYVLVSLVLFILTIRQWIKIHSVIKRSERIEKEDYILLLNTGYGPGSWGRNVFLPGNEINDTIIKHELAHVQQKHSADVVFINLAQCIFWPNIFLQAIKKELRQVHEFQADAAVDMNRKEYGELLISSIFDSCTLPMAHTFIIHPIKRRIMMLNKRRNKVWGITFSIAAITLTAFMLGNMVALQSCTTKKWEAKEEVAKNANEAKDLPPGVIKLAEKMPQFPGNLGEYIGSHLVYPADAMNRGKEGRVNVSFIVREDGTITDAEVKHLVNKQTGDTLDASLVQAAIDVVMSMPKWIPGEDKGKKVAVQYVIPISFKLGDTKISFSSLHMEEITKGEYESLSASMRFKANRSQMIKEVRGRLKQGEI